MVFIDLKLIGSLKLPFSLMLTYQISEVYLLLNFKLPGLSLEKNSFLPSGLKAG